MIKKKSYKKGTEKPIPLAINILRFQTYNFNFLETEEVIMFEYLTLKWNSFKKKIFWHASSTIQEETGIKRSRLNTILDRFEKELKIVTITVTGMPQVKHFNIHFNKIVPLLRKIYRFNKLSPENRKQLTEYFKSLAENNKPSAENNK